MCFSGGMFKKKAKATPAADAEAPAAPAKRSKLKLMLLACAPLVLAGGGYAGWAMFAGGEAGHAEAGDAHGTDDVHVASTSPDVAAETSATYSFALSVLLKRQCGKVRVNALKEASEAEAEADGMLVNASWMAANRRLDSITKASCSRMLSEISNAETRAAGAATPEPKAAAAH